MFYQLSLCTLMAFICILAAFTVHFNNFVHFNSFHLIRPRTDAIHYWHLTLSDQNVVPIAKSLLCSASHVWIIFTYNNLPDMPNTTTEISEAEGQLREWQVTLHLYVQQHVQL